MTPQPTQEQLGAILKEMKVEEYGTVTLKDTIAAITALIQEAERKVQVRCAAEMSILDQEIVSLKARIKSLNSGGSNNE